MVPAVEGAVVVAAIAVAVVVAIVIAVAVFPSRPPGVIPQRPYLKTPNLFIFSPFFFPAVLSFFSFLTFIFFFFFSLSITFAVSLSSPFG